ncbi:MAG TPA: GTP-binding protein, partial [Halanaerobiales bacterium]|nr:GTP-binding protein [Halanaerobiales bacterium]
MSVKTYFITGFLGAGKTTLLNRLLDDLHGKRVGVILNEFGQLNVDASLVDLNQYMKMAEINNGSIFCSCLSGSFVREVIKFSRLDLDYLLVESSGMSRPASIDAILRQVKEMNNTEIDYRGMIALVDASTFPEIHKTVNAVREQIVYSDLIII